MAGDGDVWARSAFGWGKVYDGTTNGVYSLAAMDENLYAGLGTAVGDSVVLEFKPGADPGARRIAALTRDWSSLPGLPAVRGERIHVIRHDDALLPGPRMAEVAREVSRALHPEAWRDEGAAP